MEAADPLLLLLREEQLRLGEPHLGLGHLAGLRHRGLPQRRLGLLKVRLGGLELDAKRLLVDHEQELSLLDVGPLGEVPLV